MAFMEGMKLSKHRNNYNLIAIVINTNEKSIEYFKCL